VPNIVIRDFPKIYSSYEIKTLFKKYGTVKHVDMKPDKNEAVVTMAYLHQAQQAVKKLSGSKIMGRAILVEMV